MPFPIDSLLTRTIRLLTQTGLTLVRRIEGIIIPQNSTTSKKLKYHTLIVPLFPNIKDNAGDYYIKTLMCLGRYKIEAD